MQIGVTTPTGKVGSRVTELLIQAGVRPTLLLRDPSKLSPEVSGKVHAVRCDQRDTDAVVEATKGVDALFWVAPPTPGPDPVAAYASMGGNAVRAIQHNGIGRTVFLSSVGAEKRHGVGEIDGLARTEEQLDRLDVAVTHLRCGYFFSNLLLSLDQLKQGVLATTFPLDYSMPWVDPRDIGDVAAARLLHEGWSGRQVQAVHGPCDLTFAQVAEIVSQSTGRSVKAVEISDDDLRKTLLEGGLGAKQVEGFVGMPAGLREDFTPEDERSLLTTTPTGLGAWAHTVLRPLLA
ncbi:NAD(P)H-binding protein [Streptomyces sp. NBC_00457]|uniref:NmrA family NAD(P)-binding protein n=1 Tax=unclassified Streptomyces TaxID=2593676 RepID=UPI002E23641F|nr:MULTISPECIES: NAD(P)H-binding protein [unclassified Streptomyces]